MAKAETYQEFVKKFKPKKTTDDCYTPKEVYEAVKTWTVEQYKLESYNIVRPFYPGGDYESYKYTDNDVIIDNPPFSILAKIVSFYLERNIKFFLFCPTVSAMNYLKHKEVTIVLTGLQKIVYENGAKVPTQFITNLDKSTAIRLNNELWARIEPPAKRENIKTKYEYPPNVLSAFHLNTLLKKDTKRTIDISISRDEAMGIEKLDEQKGKRIYGGGVLLSDNVVNKLEPLKYIKNNSKVVWQFSDREKEIIKQLNQSN